MTVQALAAMPAITRDFDRAMADLRETGACVIADALEPGMLAEVRDAVFRAADSDDRRGWRQAYGYGKDDHVNQRVWNLPSRDPVFCDLAEHPLAIRVLTETIGWPALLSSMSANITGRGGEAMMLHCDQGYMPLPWAGPHGVNLAWCVTDFTEANGATCIVPGSHLLNTRGGDGFAERLQPVEAPAGSLIVIEGRTLHTNGANTSGERRAGIFAWHTLPIYLPQENWFLSLNPAIRQFGSETLQTLFGFRPGVLGRINGLDRL